MKKAVPTSAEPKVSTIIITCKTVDAAAPADRFSRFLECAGQFNGEPVNVSKLAKHIGIAGKTVAEY